jgi:hypothetical protein
VSSFENLIGLFGTLRHKEKLGETNLRNEDEFEGER